MNAEKEQLKTEFHSKLDDLVSQATPGTTQEDILTSRFFSPFFTRLGLTIPQFQENMNIGQVSPEHLREIINLLNLRLRLLSYQGRGGKRSSTRKRSRKSKRSSTGKRSSTSKRSRTSKRSSTRSKAKKSKKARS